jgi:hypothetical protein
MGIVSTSCVLAESSVRVIVTTINLHLGVLVVLFFHLFFIPRPFLSLGGVRYVDGHCFRRTRTKCYSMCTSLL